MVQPLPTWEQELNISCLLSSGCWGQICPNDQTRALPRGKGQSCGFGAQRGLQKSGAGSLCRWEGARGTRHHSLTPGQSSAGRGHTYCPDATHSLYGDTHTTVVTTRLLIPDSSLGILGKLHCGILSLAGEHQAHPRLLPGWSGGKEPSLERAAREHRRRP